MATVTQQLRQSGYQEPPAAPFLADATGWSDLELEQFASYINSKKNDKDHSRATSAGRDHARVTASPSWNQGAARNGQDDFSGGHSMTRATFWSYESGQEEQNSEQIRWDEHAKMHHERIMTERDPQMEKSLKPQWLGGEGFGSTKRRMSVAEIEIAMLNGDMEDEEVDRLLSAIYEEDQESKIASKDVRSVQKVVEIMDIGVEVEEKNRALEKATHECQNQSTSGSHGYRPMNKETYATQAKSTETAAEEPARDPMVSVSNTSEVSAGASDRDTIDTCGESGFLNSGKAAAGGSSVGAVSDNTSGAEERMGGESSKQTNLVVVENLQKALLNHDEQKRKMQLGPGGFPGGNFGKIEDNEGKPGYAGLSFHVETFFLVLGACGAIAIALYLLFKCAREGSCLPTYLRAAVEGNSSIRRRVGCYRPSPAEDYEIRMHPELEMQNAMRGKYEPGEFGSGQHERIYPQIDKGRENRASTAESDYRRSKEVNVMGVGLG